MASVGDLSGLYDASQTLLRSILTLQRRLLADLAATAERMETAVGLPAMPDPPA